jgi:trigger factor
MTETKKDTIKVDILESKPCSVLMNIQVPHPEVAEETERVYQNIQKVAQVPGFRVGKAPLHMIKQSYVATAREKAIENLIRRTLFASLKEQGIEPIDSPVIDEVSFEFDKPFSYKIRAERHPEFTVKDYKGIKITKEIHPVTDARVTEQLDALRERNARLVASKAETVAADHFLMVDYDCFKGDEPLTDLKAKNQLLDLSSPQALAGFKEGLVGAKRGEERDVNVKFPADYPNKKLAGQDIKFKVKILEIKEKQLPALDDELAKDFGLANLDELKAKVRESTDAEEQRRQHQEIEKQMLDHLVKVNEFPVPDSLVEEQLNHLMKRMEEYLRRQGMSQDEWNKNIPRWREKYRPEAERTVRVSYILRAIGDVEKLDVTDADLEAELKRLKEANPERQADVEKYFAEQKDVVASNLKEEKIFKFLLDNAKVKEETKEPKKA